MTSKSWSSRLDGPNRYTGTHASAGSIALLVVSIVFFVFLIIVSKFVFGVVFGAGIWISLDQVKWSLQPAVYPCTSDSVVCGSASNFRKFI